MEAEFARRLHPFDRRREFATEGAASSVSWLRSRCRLSGGAAQRRVEIARNLPEIPLTERAFRDGALGVEHAAVVARLASDVGAEAAREVEQTLVDAAARLDPARLNWVAQHARQAIDPDGARRDANAAHERRRLHLSQTLDGVFVLDGLFDAEAGALLRTAIDALDTPVPGEQRTAAQRRADALIELVRRQLQHGALPEVAGQRPHLTVTVTDTTLRRDAGSLGADARWAGPLVQDAARRIACDAALTPMTVDAAGTPLDAGRTRRTIPAAMRRALMVRDRGCRFPTCDRPPEWTEGHHLRHWIDGGATDMANIASLCTLHHRLVHEQGWTLHPDPDGGLIATPPEDHSRHRWTPGS